ncbi:hypothetical protein V492_05248 [Pseudogymnoascus sp. VKM F-4246]|nr:hypothetical protein V492_05248 [Pseudogymnoascus sp. VKM F-4246]
MRSTLIAAVLIAPVLVLTRPVTTPDTKMVLTPDTFSPPDLSGAPIPAKHTSPHHFANGMTDEGLKRVMGGRGKTLTTPKEDIIVHPYRPYADPTNGKEREHFELFEGAQKVHPRGFLKKVRNTDNTDNIGRPHPDDHHLAPNAGMPIHHARTTDNTDRPHPDDHHLAPNAGMPIHHARATDNTDRPHPDDHHLAPNVGMPIHHARASDNTKMLPRPNGHLLPPKIGTPINARATGDTKMLPRPNGHILPPKIGTPINARAIDNTERPYHPSDHHLGPKIGTPINAKREESEGSEEIDDQEETPVELPISSDYYPEEHDDAEEMPVDLPIASDYDYEEFDDQEEIPLELPFASDYYTEEFDDEEEIPVELPFSDYYTEEFDDQDETPDDLPTLSDYYTGSPYFEDTRYVPATPGDRNARRPDRLAGPPYPCAGPVHFNGTGFNSTINGTAFNTTTNITAKATGCFEKTTSDIEENSEPTLDRRGQDHKLPVIVQDFADKKKKESEKAAKDKASKEKRPNAPAPAKPKPKGIPTINDHAPELFDYFSDPFNKKSPFGEDKKFADEFFDSLGKPRHPLWWAQRGVEDLEPPKREPVQYTQAGKPKEYVGFDQGDAWKTDYFQNGVWDQPRVPNVRKPYWTEGNPVY